MQWLTLTVQMVIIFLPVLPDLGQDLLQLEYLHLCRPLGVLVDQSRLHSFVPPPSRRSLYFSSVTWWTNHCIGWTAPTSYSIWKTIWPPDSHYHLMTHYISFYLLVPPEVWWNWVTRLRLGESLTLCTRPWLSPTSSRGLLGLKLKQENYFWKIKSHHDE